MNPKKINLNAISHWRPLTVPESDTLLLTNHLGVGLTHMIAGQRWGPVTATFTRSIRLRKMAFHFPMERGMLGDMNSSYQHLLSWPEDLQVSLWSLHNMTEVCHPQVFFTLSHISIGPPTGFTYHTSWCFTTDALSLIMLYIALYLAQM